MEVQLAPTDESDAESDGGEESSSTSVVDVAQGGMKNVKVDVENEDYRLAEETSRAEEDMSNPAEVVTPSELRPCKYCGRSPQQSRPRRLLAWLRWLPQMLWMTAIR